MAMSITLCANEADSFDRIKNWSSNEVRRCQKRISEAEEDVDHEVV
jgi:endo-1,4-beta-D-glucanase Y